MSEPYETALSYQETLTSFFTGGTVEEPDYIALRRDLLENPLFKDNAPTFLRRCRDTSSLWSFAKSVDPSWEPRRKFIRDVFEPLLDALENGGSLPGTFHSNAWTGVQNPAQRVKAVQTLIPVAQAAVGSLIKHLEAPRHNGGPPLEEVETALSHLRELHSALGALLAAANEGILNSTLGEGVIGEIARYAKRAAKALKYDPMPYAVSASILAILTACGVPNIAGYLMGVALAIRKEPQDTP